MQQPTSHHRRLRRLRGTFRGQETHHSMPGFAETHATASVTGRFTLNGLFLLRDYVTHREGKVLYRGHGVYGWDDARKLYTIYWFDTAGTEPVAPGIGSWQDEVLIFDYMRGGRPMRLRYRFWGEDRYTFAVEGRVEGDGWEIFLEGDYHRVR